MSIITRLTPILPVHDVLPERRFYEQLGFTVYVNPKEPYPEDEFVALRAGDHVLFGLWAISTVDGLTTESRLWWQFETSDLDALHARACDTFITVEQGPTVEAWGRRTLKLRSPAGYLVTFEEQEH